MAKGQQFSLDGFRKNPDGSYSKISNPQPRETPIFKKTLPITVEQHLPLPQDFVEIKSIFKKRTKKEPEPTFWKGKNIQDIFKEANENNFIFIPQNVPSSKNSKRAFKKIVLESLICVEYRKKTEANWQVFKYRFLEMCKGKEKPYKIEMMFIRNSKHKADFHNLVQLPMDIMVKYGWIEDDNMDEVIPVPAAKPYAIDKHVPGIIIRVV